MSVFNKVVSRVRDFFLEPDGKAASAKPVAPPLLPRPVQPSNPWARGRINPTPSSGNPRPPRAATNAEPPPRLPPSFRGRAPPKQRRPKPLFHLGTSRPKSFNAVPFPTSSPRSTLGARPTPRPCRNAPPRAASRRQLSPPIFSRNWRRARLRLPHPTRFAPTCPARRPAPPRRSAPTS